MNQAARRAASWPFGLSSSRLRPGPARSACSPSEQLTTHATTTLPIRIRPCRLPVALAGASSQVGQLFVRKPHASQIHAEQFLPLSSIRAGELFNNGSTTTKRCVQNRKTVPAMLDMLWELGLPGLQNVAIHACGPYHWRSLVADEYGHAEIT